MRILHLSSSDLDGGAARSAYRLHAGLRRLGIDSVMLVARKKSDDPTVKTFVPPMDFLSRWRRRLRRKQIAQSLSPYRLSRPEGYETFRDDRSPHGATMVRQLPPCDLIHLRWIVNFVGYEAVYTLASRRIPLVWTLDDMNPLTGGCHFDDGCGRFATRCGICPQLGSADPIDLSHRIWRRKLRLFSRIDSSRLHIVAPSRSMARIVKESPLLNRFPLTVIPYGLDTDVFVPRLKRAARLQLGLPQNVAIILFVAASVRVRRKGLDLLARALSQPLNGHDVYLVSVGNGQPDLSIPVPHQHIGKIDDDGLLSHVYSAADIFVCPSLQDNLPNTVLEAMACGTPVVAFDAGGIPDMVRPEVTGLLAPTGDAEALRAAIMNLLRDSTRRAAMAAACRSTAVREYTLEVQARRHAELYETTLQQASRPRLPKAQTYSSSES